MRRALQIGILGILTFYGVTVFGRSVNEGCGFISLYDEGDTWTYTVYDKKGKESGTMNYLVDGKRTSGDSTILDITTTTDIGKKGEDYTMQLAMACLNGNFYVSMDRFVNTMMQQMQSMEIELTTQDMEVPIHPEVGQTLPDAVTTMKASTSGITVMNLTVTVKNRIVSGKESITTDAGTFNCFIIEQTTEVENKTQMLTSRNSSSTKEWYDPDYGMVKSESYDKKGNLESSTVLTAVSR